MPTIEKPDDQPNPEEHVTDLELDEPESEEDDYESVPPNYQISTHPADFTLEGLYQKWKSNDIEVPSFQRDFVWTKGQASKLIESFLVGLPVPAIFLYTDTSQKHLVIDGQQRLKSVFFFFEGRFGSETTNRRKTFKLAGLNQRSAFFNKSYEEFSNEEKRRLNNSVLRAFIIQQLDPTDDTSIYHIFERLNTGGTLLKNQEIRNCVYHGEFVSLLNEMNKNTFWREILGKKEPDARKRDIEFIVRFLSMRDISDYKKPMKDWLSKFMSKCRKASKETLDADRNLFEQTCKVIIETLGKKPFHVRTGLNASMFDAVMTSFSKRLNSIPADIDKRYEKLKADKEFQEKTRTATTDEETVKYRFNKAEQILFH